MFDVLVIGGGPAGVTAALRARELGATVGLVERDRMGGTCTNDGCVPTRVLARAARLMRETALFDDYGLIIQPPELDFQQLMARTQQIVYRIHEKKQIISQLEEVGITVYTQTGNAQFVDEHTIELENGSRIQGSKIILCVGGHSRRLEFPGAEYALSHRDLWTLQTLPKSMIVVGGAATGSQVASIFNTFGTRVLLLERASQILFAEDELVSRSMRKAFEERGIQIITGLENIERIERHDSGLELVFQEGGQTHSVETEAVLLTVGWPGNVDTLNLDAAHILHERSFIQVDDYLRTSVPHIFAAGDITGRMMLVQSAGYDARIAAENAVLGIGQAYKHQIVPHGGFTDPEYASVGLTEAQARAQGDVVVATVPYSDLDRAVIDDRTEGFCKLVVSADNHRFLGAHVVGEQAVEIIQIVAAGMASDMWVEQLAEMELAYPTFTSVIGLAARKIVRDLGVLPLAPQWVALGKPHAEWERG